MNDIQIFDNEELKLKVRTIQNEDGSISVNAEDTAKGFGWIQLKNNKEYVRWETINSFIDELEFSQQVGKDDYIPESLFYMLAMKANNKTAQEFQKWIAIKVIPDIRKTGSYQVEEKKPTCIEDVLISSLQEMKALKSEVQAIKQSNQETKEEIQGIREAVALEPNQWRKDTSNLINKIANKLGGFEHIKPIREEAYKLLNNSYGVNINRRLLNKQKNMALEGCSKTKIKNTNYLDAIAEDKKLINGYINIVGKLAIKYGV